MTEIERVNHIIATTKSRKCKRDYLKYREKLLKKLEREKYGTNK